MMRETQIMEKLEKIEKEVEQIKTHMVDRDSIMTEDDYEALLTYREEKKGKRLVSHEELKKELEI